MTTKREILMNVGRRVGDQSAGFLERAAAPELDNVLLDLAGCEALARIRRTAVYLIEKDRGDFDTRELTQTTPDPPAEILALTVYAWGVSRGRIARAWTLDDFRGRRLRGGADARGKWQTWWLHENRARLEVWPPAGDDEEGAECEVEYIASPRSIGMDEDVADIMREDVECIVNGIQARLANEFEELAIDAAAAMELYERGKQRMWGRVHNSRPGRVRPRGF